MASSGEADRPDGSIVIRVRIDGEESPMTTRTTQETAQPKQDLIAISPMKSESKRILQMIQRNALNPITDKPMLTTSDQVMEEALEFFYQHLKRKKVV